MSMRVNAPLIDQRTERGSDGRAPEDGNMDCVPVALASMARGLRPSLAGHITGDGLHDAVYGEGYVGMQDPAKFYGVLASSSYGLRIRAYRAGTAAQLYAYAAEAVWAGKPVLLSIPSDWNNEPPRSAFAHMIAACDVTDHLGTHLTAMNPWGGFYQTQARAWWVERLDHCAYKAAWVMERTERIENVSWQQQSDKTGRDDKGHVCAEGCMNYLQDPENAHLLASDGLLDERYYRSDGAFLPLESGAIVRGVKDEAGHWHFDQNGAAVLVDVWQQLRVAQGAPPPASDPVAQACKAAIVSLVTALDVVKP